MRRVKSLPKHIHLFLGLFVVGVITVLYVAHPLFLSAKKTFAATVPTVGTFLLVDGLIGDSKATDHTGAFEPLSYEWVKNQVGTEDLTVQLSANASIGKFFDQATTGGHVKTVTLIVGQQDGQQLQWKLSDVVLNYFSSTGLAEDARSVVKFTLTPKKLEFKMIAPPKVEEKKKQDVEPVQEVVPPKVSDKVIPEQPRVALPPPSAPILLSPAAGSATGDLIPRLMWSTIDRSVVAYRFYIENFENNQRVWARDWTVWTAGSANVAECVDSSGRWTCTYVDVPSGILSPGTTYRWSVEAMNGSVSSGYTISQTFQTPVPRSSGGGGGSAMGPPP